MRKSSQTGASSQMVIMAVVIVLVLGGLIYYATKPKSTANPYGNNTAQTTPQPSPSPAPTPTPAASSPAVTLALNAQNKSGETGTATIKDVNGLATVEVAVTGEPTGATQPMHIHLGSCANLGAVKYPLTNLVDGKSETKLTITTAQLLSQLPLAINAHKSAAAANVYVSCGDIQSTAAQPSPAPAPTTTTPPPANSAVKTFNVTETNYTIAPNVIRVNKGDTVKLNVSVTGGFHNLTVTGYGVGTDSLNAGQSTTLQFVADKTGTFEYYCSVDSHRDKGMTGQLIVQ